MAPSKESKGAQLSIVAACTKKFTELSFKERIFVTACAVVLPCIAWVAGKTIQVMWDRVEKAAAMGIEYPPRQSDFFFVLASLTTICTLRLILCNSVFYWLGERMIPKHKADRDAKLSRFSVVVFKLVYFCIFSTVLVYLVHDQPWTPPILGGSGSTLELWRGYPYQTVPDNIRYVYLIELTYHMHSLLFQICGGYHRTDFLEMTLHHSLAVGLMSYSYLANYVRMGILVLVVHDVPDIFAYGVKTFVDTSNTAATLMWYAGLLFFWGVCRLYILPFFLIWSCYAELPFGSEIENQMTSMFRWMLLGLLAMHVYWYSMFLYMGYSYATSGKVADIQDELLKKQQQQQQAITKGAAPQKHHAAQNHAHAHADSTSDSVRHRTGAQTSKN